jgi:hypothetical protein
LYWYQEAVAVYGSEPFELISHDWPSQSGEVTRGLEHWPKQNEPRVEIDLRAYP